MYLDRKQLKAEAKDAMSAARPAPFWVMLAAIGIVIVLNVLYMSLDGTWQAMRTMYAAALEGNVIYVEPQPLGGALGWVLGIAVEIMIWEISVGLLLYAMRVWRRQKAGCGDLFDSFGVFFRSIWIELLPSLLMSLWTMIYVLPVSTLVVMTGRVWWAVAGLPLLLPAIAAGYAYRLSAYLMLDNPALSCMGCVRLSRKIMRGHKWEAFLLDLSFLGWGLLCLVPIAGIILFVWLCGYMHVTNAGFYEKRMFHFMAENAPGPGPEPPAV